MVSLILSNTTKACCFYSKQNWRVREKGRREKKAKERREKSMLLAFQRDDSTGFTKSPQHRQHRREMGENGCTCFPSMLLCKLCMLLNRFVNVLETTLFVFVLSKSFLRPYFSYFKKRVWVGLAPFYPFLMLTDCTRRLALTCSYHCRYWFVINQHFICISRLH